MMKFACFGFLWLVMISLNVHAQDNPGCTDPQANNYDPLADYNDGSCTYNPTIFNPPFKYLLPDVVEETSGLIFWENYLWTINDSGNDPVLYKLDTLTGEVVQEITLSDAQNIDWESLAHDDDHIYIGDFGNNSGTRDDLGIYIVEKNVIPETGDASVNSSYIDFTYEDYTTELIYRPNNNFDCEAMICIEDSLYLFSKNWGDEKSKIYRLPKTQGNYIAELLGELNSAGLVTGADYNEEAKEISLVGYTNNTYVPFFWLLFDYHDNRLLSGNKRRIDMLNIPATQTEAVSYMFGKSGTITSEGSVLFTQSAYGFSTSAWTDSLSTIMQSAEAKAFDFVLSPNPANGNTLNAHIASLPSGNYMFEIFDSSGSLMQIKEYKILTNKGAVNVALEIGNLHSGLYFVRMRSGLTMVEKKFIKP